MNADTHRCDPDTARGEVSPSLQPPRFAAVSFATPSPKGTPLKNPAVAAVKKYIVSELQNSPTPQLDADCILQWMLGCDKTQLLLRRADLLTDAQCTAVERAVAQRKTGLPIAYITGTKEFFGYDFYVTPAVLIPKPDTELLVEQAIAAVREKMAVIEPVEMTTQTSRPRAKHKPLAICDMCAGSGCVGISILRVLEKDLLSTDYTDGTDSGRCPTDEHRLWLSLVDISADALAVARINAEQLLSERARERVRLVQSNLFERVPEPFDLIVTNPPYVPHTEARALLQDGRGEPLLALDGDVSENGDWSGTEDGLALIRRLVSQAYTHLRADGVLLMETGEYNAQAAADLFARAGFKDVRTERDLSGQLRMVAGKKC